MNNKNISNTIKQTKNFDKQIEEDLKNISISSQTPFHNKNNNSIFAENNKNTKVNFEGSRRKKDVPMFLEYGKSPRGKDNTNQDSLGIGSNINSGGSFSGNSGTESTNKESAFNQSSKFSSNINSNFPSLKPELNGPSVFGKDSRRTNNKINEQMNPFDESFKPQISRRNFLENK